MQSFRRPCQKTACDMGDDKKCDQRDAEMLARIARMDPKLLHPIKHVSQEVRAEQAVIKSS